MTGISSCPVCEELDDCEHRLVEWYGWPDERIRGSLCSLINRMEDRVRDLLVACSCAHIPPRHPGLREAFVEGVSVVESMREDAAARSKSTEECDQAYANAQIDLEELQDVLNGTVTDFVIGCLRSAPGVVTIVLEEPVSAASETQDWVSLFSADPQEVRRHLLDLLAPLEVQLDQFSFERGARAPGATAGIW